MTRTVHCVRLQREAEGLDAPPYPGDLGQRIFDNVSKEAWEEWKAHQTRVINEYRLSLADKQARTFLSQEMEKFLFGGGELAETGYVPPPKDAAKDT
ncbi:oxidative damage protection protein [Algiphilus sp.]|uniref:oxidative damage protection protein n=1 Tax=Algiphilus sp. TaxID=1872431 RepID=UPI0025B7E5E5|nr:oxidative damage protection protein [Algiphilus sp.]MCK5769347.1 oxidative damage protection protein [Algiphilus sp.]